MKPPDSQGYFYFFAFVPGRKPTGAATGQHVCQQARDRARGDANYACQDGEVLVRSPSSRFSQTCTRSTGLICAAL